MANDFEGIVICSSSLTENPCVVNCCVYGVWRSDVAVGLDYEVLLVYRYVHNVAMLDERVFGNEEGSPGIVPVDLMNTVAIS